MISKLVTTLAVLLFAAFALASSNSNQDVEDKLARLEQSSNPLVTRVLGKIQATLQDQTRRSRRDESDEVFVEWIGHALEDKEFVLTKFVIGTESNRVHVVKSHIGRKQKANEYSTGLIKFEASNKNDKEGAVTIEIASSTNSDLPDKVRGIFKFAGDEVVFMRFARPDENADDVKDFHQHTHMFKFVRSFRKVNPINKLAGSAWTVFPVNYPALAEKHCQLLKFKLSPCPDKSEFVIANLKERKIEIVSGSYDLIPMNSAGSDLYKLSVELQSGSVKGMKWNTVLGVVSQYSVLVVNNEADKDAPHEITDDFSSFVADRLESDEPCDRYTRKNEKNCFTGSKWGTDALMLPGGVNQVLAFDPHSDKVLVFKKKLVKADKSASSNDDISTLWGSHGFDSKDHRDIEIDVETVIAEGTYRVKRDVIPHQVEVEWSSGPHAWKKCRGIFSELGTSMIYYLGEPGADKVPEFIPINMKELTSSRFGLLRKLRAYGNKENCSMKKIGTTAKDIAEWSWHGVSYRHHIMKTKHTKSVLEAMAFGRSSSGRSPALTAVHSLVDTPITKGGISRVALWRLAVEALTTSLGEMRLTARRRDLDESIDITELDENVDKRDRDVCLRSEFHMVGDQFMIVNLGMPAKQQRHEDKEGLYRDDSVILQRGVQTIKKKEECSLKQYYGALFGGVTFSKSSGLTKDKQIESGEICVWMMVHNGGALGCGNFEMDVDKGRLTVTFHKEMTGSAESEQARLQGMVAQFLSHFQRSDTAATDESDANLFTITHHGDAVKLETIFEFIGDDILIANAVPGKAVPKTFDKSYLLVDSQRFDRLYERVDQPSTPPSAPVDIQLMIA